MSTHIRTFWGAGLALALALSACGGSDDKGGEGATASKTRLTLNGADAPRPADFPQTQGRTLQEVADGIGVKGPEVGLASSVFTPGENRFAFGLIDTQSRPLYGPTAVYVAPTPGDKATGPFLAPTDLLVTEPPYRSKQAATEQDPFAAIYAANVKFTKPGKWAVLVATKSGARLVAGPTQVTVQRKPPVPAVGDKAPVVDTDTLASAGGNIKAIDTRVPADDMHGVNLKDVAGKKPVALLFATPQLCQSRVCGPVVDIAAQLKQKYGERMEFIHQEVYVDNDPNKGLRPPLQRYGLPTEPWLFVIGSDGRVAARLEGSFGLRAFENAIKAGLAEG